MTTPNTNIDDLFFSSHIDGTPAEVIYYLLDEATRRTYGSGDNREFGWAANTFFHHKDLDKRINEYIERLLSAAKESELEQLENDMENSDRPNADWYREPFECFHDLIDSRRKALKEK